VRKLYADFRSTNIYLPLFFITFISDNKDASLAEIHDFVKKIPQLTKEYKSLDQVCVLPVIASPHGHSLTAHSHCGTFEKNN
jgi:hypothetical protein